MNFKTIKDSYLTNVNPTNVGDKNKSRKMRRKKFYVLVAKVRAQEGRFFKVYQCENKTDKYGANIKCEYRVKVSKSYDM